MLFIPCIVHSIGCFPQAVVPQHKPMMAYVQNRQIKLGIDLNLGGSITYLAPTDHQDENVVNSSDLGRQIQLSFYSGPVPYHPAGSAISDYWKFLGWNPIQSGDVFGNGSKILSSKIGGNRIYIKCIPMHWPLKNVPGECKYEVWLELDGPTVKAHCRLTNKRPDLTQYSARAQELPAVYVNAPYHHLMSYTGADPFAGKELTEIHNRLDKENTWASWIATENWAAQVDDKGWGLGIWNPATTRFSGGFFGEPGVGGPSDSPTGYIAPNRTEILDHNIIYDFSYVLILGKLEDIRSYVGHHTHQNQVPSWRFDRTRCGWSYENATDTGWPIRGTLNFDIGQQPVLLNSPEFSFSTSKRTVLSIESAFAGPISKITLEWKSLGESTFNPKSQLVMHCEPDGKTRSYRFPVGDSLAHPELLTQVRFRFVPEGSGKSTAKVRCVRFTP